MLFKKGEFVRIEYTKKNESLTSTSYESVYYVESVCADYSNLRFINGKKINWKLFQTHKGYNKTCTGVDDIEDEYGLMQYWHKNSFQYFEKISKVKKESMSNNLKKAIIIKQLRH